MRAPSLGDREKLEKPHPARAGPGRTGRPGSGQFGPTCSLTNLSWLDPADGLTVPTQFEPAAGQPSSKPGHPGAPRSKQQQADTTRSAVRPPRCVLILFTSQPRLLRAGPICGRSKKLQSDPGRLDRLKVDQFSSRCGATGSSTGPTGWSGPNRAILELTRFQGGPGRVRVDAGLACLPASLPG